MCACPTEVPDGAAAGWVCLCAAPEPQLQGQLTAAPGAGIRLAQPGQSAAGTEEVTASRLSDSLLLTHEGT